MATRVLEQFFGDKQNAMISGVTVQLGPEEDAPRVKIFLRVGFILGDEPALKDLLSCKGHAGLKPCFRCKNVTLYNAKEKGTPIHERSEWLVSICEFDTSKFKMHTDQSLVASLQRRHGLKHVLGAGKFA